MLSRETRWALLWFGLVLAFPLMCDDPWAHNPRQLATVAIAVFVVARAFLVLLHTGDMGDVSKLRGAVVESPFARSLGATLRKAIPAPVIEVPIPDVGAARARFLSAHFTGWLGTVSASSVWIRLRLKSPALQRAPRVQIEGNSSFLLPAALVGAKALALSNPERRWRYWRLPWRSPETAVEDAAFCAALPIAKRTFVLTSRPGRLQIRADCKDDASPVFEDAVRLAIAWVQAVQRTSGASPR